MKRVKRAIDEALGNFHAYIERLDRSRSGGASTSPWPGPGLRRADYLALVESKTKFSPQERREVLDRAAKVPVTEEERAQGDALFAEYLKGLESGELSSHPRSPSQSRG